MDDSISGYGGTLLTTTKTTKRYQNLTRKQSTTAKLMRVALKQQTRTGFVEMETGM